MQSTILAHPRHMDSSHHTDAASQSRETRVFLFLTVILAPALAVAVVGGYGLIIWLFQLFAGPPQG